MLTGKCPYEPLSNQMEVQLTHLPRPLLTMVDRCGGDAQENPPSYPSQLPTQSGRVPSGLSLPTPVLSSSPRSPIPLSSLPGLLG
jgi:hypothetical protein